MYYLEFDTRFGLFYIVCDTQFIYSSFFYNNKNNVSIKKLDKLIKFNESTINNKYNINCELIDGILYFINQYFYLRKAIFFNLLKLKLSYNSVFQLNIINTIHDIPYGKTKSYKEVAKLNNSNAYRAVGNICANNKFLILIPCHRVIKNNYNIGNYIFGEYLKFDIIKYENQNIKLS